MTELAYECPHDGPKETRLEMGGGLVTLDVCQTCERLPLLVSGWEIGGHPERVTRIGTLILDPQSDGGWFTVLRADAEAEP